ncbi:hypothetical protein C8R45DRAFT_947346 [Mycena sanguinolenta]|nr:hypothetical protein C8R45DRAFT_947346 [Mycena sanguinolenta]
MWYHCQAWRVERRPDDGATRWRIRGGGNYDRRELAWIGSYSESGGHTRPIFLHQRRIRMQERNSRSLWPLSAHRRRSYTVNGVGHPLAKVDDRTTSTSGRKVQRRRTGPSKGTSDDRPTELARDAQEWDASSIPHPACSLFTIDATQSSPVQYRPEGVAKLRPVCIPSSSSGDDADEKCRARVTESRGAAVATRVGRNHQLTYRITHTRVKRSVNDGAVESASKDSRERSPCRGSEERGGELK